MSKQLPVSVVTTIQPPTESIRQLSRVLQNNGCPLIVIGDAKGPFEYNVAGAELVTFNQQLALPFSLATLLPQGHYARKNLGFLLAFKRGATCIYETDDDNMPLPTWRWRDLKTDARPMAGSGWVNVYRAFTDLFVWPRGFPLEYCRQSFSNDILTQKVIQVESPIQQGLSNGSPDVDAVWRLVMDKTITFRDGMSVILPRNAWCPFNSQSTWWWPAAYPLMYLPSHCSFRMTDIWRSLVAQRCVWEWNTGIVFHTAEVVQVRNEHNLMKNFEDEVSGYLRNAEIARQLSSLHLQTGVEAVEKNLQTCYELLVDMGVFQKEELALLKAWLVDVKSTKVQQLAGKH